MMGKSASERPYADNEAMAYSKHIRVSPQKLNLVAESIRGMDCELALAELHFSRRRVSSEVRKVLEAVHDKRLESATNLNNPGDL